MNGEDNKTFQDHLDLFKSYSLNESDLNPPVEEKEVEKVEEEDTPEVSKKVQDHSDLFNSYAQTNAIKSVTGGNTLPEYLPNSLGVGDSKLDYQGPDARLTDEQVVNIDEVRGSRQSNFDKWANGTMKLVGKTGVNVLGGTVGAVNGLVTGMYKGIKEGDWSGFYNNGFANALDDINEKLDGALPNYYTKAEQEMKFWQKLGTANFISDQMFNGVSFLAGALFTEMAWGAVTAASGGLALPGFLSATANNVSRVKRILKGIDRTADSKKIKAGVDAFKKQRRVKQALTIGRQMYTGAGYEAGVEGRAHYDSLKADLIKRAEIENEAEGKGPVTQDQMQEIENMARAHANGVFSAQLPLIGVGNMLMLGKLYGPGKDLQKIAMNGMRRLNPNFMKPIALTGKGADQTAQAAYKSNKFLKGLGLSDKWVERANRTGTASKKILATPTYEGFVEEGGQKLIDLTSHDYAMTKYSGEAIDNTSALIRAFNRGLHDTYTTDEGLTEVMMGFMLGLIGIPGFKGANDGGMIAAHGRIKNMYKNEAMQEKVADFYNNNRDLFGALKANAEFSNEMYTLNGLQDRALADNNDAQFKNIEHDKLFSYVKAKLLTGQYEDIAEDSEAIRKMSNEEFTEFFGYRKEDFASENDITKRKNDVVESVKKRARKIKESYDTVEGLNDWGSDPLSKDRNGILRDELAHSLSVIDNVQERKTALTKLLAKLTNGKIKGSKISYVTPEGKPVEFDLESFSGSSYRGEYRILKDLLKRNDNAPESEKLTEEQLTSIEGRMNMLKTVINNETGPVDLTNLSEEEANLYNIVKPQLDELSKEDPSKGIKDRQEEVIRLLKDLRHLRGRSQEFISKFNAIAYNKNAREQRIQQIEEYAEDSRKEAAENGFLKGKAKELFSQYGSSASFTITKDGETKTYRFADNGDLLEDGTTEVADPEVLNEVKPENITDDRVEDAKKALKAIEELKAEKGVEAEENAKEIAKVENDLKKLLNSIEKGKSVKIGGLVQSVADINKIIKKSKRVLKKLQKQSFRITEQIEYLNRFISKFYDPNTDSLVVTLSDVGKYLEKALDAQMLSFEELASKDLNNIDGLERKLAKIMKPVTDWLTQSQKSQTLIAQKISELRNHRDSLYKVLFDKLRSRQSKALIGYKDVNNFEELYLEVIDEISKMVKSYEQNLKAKLPLRKGITKAENKKLISQLPQLKKELALLLNDKFLSSYEEYKEFTFFANNSKKLELLEGLGLQKLNDVEQALLDRRFDMAELEATESEMKDLIQVVEDINALDREGDASGQGRLAIQLLEHAKLQDAFNQIIGALKEVEDNVKKIVDPPGPARDEPTTAAPDANPPVKETTKEEFEQANPQTKTYKRDISDAFNSLTANQNANKKTVLEYAVKDENSNVNFLDLQPLEGLSEQELANFNNARRQLNSLNFFSQYKFKEYEGGKPKYKFIPFTQAGDVLPRNSFYTNDGWADQGDSSNPLTQAVHLVLADETGTPIQHNGEIVYMPMRSGIDVTQGDNWATQFTNNNNLSRDYITSMILDYNTLRQEIIAGKHKYVPFIGTTRGSVDYSRLTANPLMPVHGRALPESTPLSEAEITILTGVSDANGMLPVSMRDGGKSYRFNSGQPFINLGGQVAPLNSRFVNGNEADLILQLLRKFESNFLSLVKDAPQVDKNTLNTAFKEAEVIGVESIDGNLLWYIQDITQMGTDTLKGERPFSFVSNYGSKQLAGYLFGDKFISSQDVLDNNPAKMSELRNYLLTKKTNALNLKLNNKKAKHIVPVFNDNLELIDSIVYTNYEEYLLKPRANGDAPLIMTKMDQISNDLFTPSFNSVYPKFSVGPAEKTSNPIIIKEESVNPKPSVGSPVSSNTAELVQRLKSELTKEKDPTKRNNLEKRINSLEKAGNSLGGRGTRYSKKSNDALIQDIKDKAQKHREENDESEINMIYNTPVSVGEAQRDKLRYIDANSGNPILKSEIEKAKKMLSKTEFTIVDGFIKGNAAGIVGQLKGQGNILVSNIAPGGTVYHEAFHQVSYFLLPDAARIKMYNEVQGSEGSVKTYKGEIKKFSELNNKEVEEHLAEEFRKWILSNGEYKKDLYSAKTNKGFFARMFEKIRTVVRSLLGLDTRFEVDPTMTMLANVFQSIESGKFADSNPIENRNSDIVANMALLPNTDATRSQEIINVITNYFSHELFYGPESSLNIHDINLLTTPERKKEFTSKVNKAYDAAFIKMQEALSVKYEMLTEEADMNEVIKDIYYLRNNEANIKDVHRLWLNTIGINFSFEYNMVAEENARGKQAYNIFNSNEFSAITTARPAIKILVGTLPNIGVTNSLGLEPAVDPQNAMNYLHEHLNGITDRHTQINKLKGLTGKQPWIKELVRRLKDPSSETLSQNDVALQIQFAQNFSQPKNKFNTQLISKNPNDATLNILTSDANKVQRHSNVKFRWKANLASLAGTDKNSLVKLVEDQFVIDLNAPIEFTSKGKKLSILKLKKDKSILDAESSLELFEAFGVQFSDRISMLDGQSDIKIDGKSIPVIVQEAAKGFVDYINVNNPLADIFDSEVVDSQSRIKRLIEAELKFRTSLIELRHKGADNKDRYGIGLPTHIDFIADKLGAGIIPEHLKPENNPYTANSMIVKAILAGKQAIIDVAHIEGLKIHRPGAIGQLTSDASPASRLSIYINNVLNGVHPLLRTGDSKQERALDFGPDSVFKRFDDAEALLLGYVRDEINTVRERRLNGYGNNINLYKDNGNDLRIFKGIFKSADNNFLSDLDSTLNGKISVDEFFAMHETNKSAKENLPTTVVSLIKDYLNAKTFEVIDMLVDHGALKRATPTSVNYTNNLISKDLIQKFIPDLRTLGWKQSHVNKVIGAFVLNDFIGTVEQTKLIFGDLANYNTQDFFKRTNLAVGAKRLAVVDTDLNEWLNVNMPRPDGKVQNGTANVMVFEEPITESVYADLYESMGIKNSEDYLNMKEADGHAFANMHFYREFLMRTGDWTTDQDNLYKQMFDMETGDPTGIVPDGFLASFPTIKPQYFGPQLINGKPSLPFSLKFSLSPIIPHAVQGTDLTSLMYNMQDRTNVTDMVLFPSAAKIGHKVNTQGKAPELYSLSGQLNPIPDNGHSVISLENFGIQLDISQKFKDEVSRGTQPVTIILSDLAKSDNLEMQDKISEYIDLLNGKTSKDFNSLLDKLGIKQTEKGFSIPDKTKLINLLQEESILRKYPENVAQGINSLLSQENKYQKLDALVNKSDLERLLYSLVDTQVIRKKFKGDLRVQQSALGYNTEARTVMQDEDGTIKLMNPTSTGPFISLEDYDSLKFYNVGEDGNTTAMEVYMPHYFQEYLGGGNLTIREDGVYNGDIKIGNNDLLELIGFRIPTDGFHSIDFIKIKGFLPAEAGPVVVVPAELTVKVGMDFDIDKFNLYFPSYRVKVDGSLVKRQYIDGDTNFDETLRLHYDALYKPTLDFFVNIDRALEEIDIELELGQRDAIIDITADRMIKAIFGDDAITELGGYTSDEIDVILKAFKQYDSANLPGEFKPVSEYAIEKYQELRKRIGEIPTFESWAEQNRGKPTAELNHSGAIQNKLMELQKYFLSHPDNFEKLLSPTSTKDAKNVAEMIRNLKGQSENENSEWSDIISFKNKQQAAHRMWAGMDTLGIFAVNNTHHVKAQLAGLELPQQQTGLMDTVLYVDGMQGLETIDFGGVSDLDGNNIKETLSQLLNAAADVTKDPFLFDLNITPQTANVAMTLIRGGVPLEWTALFLNQPIILEYLELKSINDNPILEETGDKLYTSEILQVLKNNFKGPMEDRKIPTKSIKTHIQGEALRSMIDLDIPSMQKNHQLVGMKTPVASTLNLQLQILKDYLNYDKIGSSLASLTSTTSFDTVPPMNRHDAAISSANVFNSLTSSPFLNAQNLIDNTHIASLYNTSFLAETMFNDLFEISVGRVFNDTGIYNIVNNLNISKDKKLKTLETYENDLVTALLTKDANLESRVMGLFFGSNSLPNRVQKLKNLDLYRNNKFLKDLLPIIRTDRKGNQTDNLKYYSLLRNTFEQNVSRDSFFALPIELQNDIVDFAIVQGGLNFSDMALLRLIPNEVYLKKGLKLVRTVQNYKTLGKDNTIKSFNDLFFRNNWNNKDIVPHVTPQRFAKLWKGKDDRFGTYPYIVKKFREGGEYKTELYKRTENVKRPYVQINKLGKGKFFKEYLQSNLIGENQVKSIFPDNNMDRKPTGVTIVENLPPTDTEVTPVKITNISKQLSLFRHQDKENSKDCN
tara:strand:- start:7151 stop:19927 length:12777 start_codon:yes stop_codon:yes gene_type:complete